MLLLLAYCYQAGLCRTVVFPRTQCVIVRIEHMNSAPTHSIVQSITSILFPNCLWFCFFSSFPVSPRLRRHLSLPATCNLTYRFLRQKFCAAEPQATWWNSTGHHVLRTLLFASLSPIKNSTWFSRLLPPHIYLFTLNQFRLPTSLWCETSFAYS